MIYCQNQDTFDSGVLIKLSRHKQRLTQENQDL